MKLLFVLTFVHALVLPGWSQVMIPEANGPAKQQVFIQLGLEPAWVATIGYSHLMSRHDRGTKVYLGGSLKFAPLIISQGAWRLNVTPMVYRQLSQKWKGVLTSDLYLAHNRNRAGTFNGLGFELRAAMLHKGEQWTKGFEAGWQYTALAHLRHSDAAKDTFNDRYPSGTTQGEGPVDGWYGGTASRFRLGFSGSRKLTDHLAFQLGIGSLVSFQKQGVLLSFAHAQVPLYLISQLTYSW